MRIAILAAAMACGLATGAQAAVRYSLVNPTYNQAAQDAGERFDFSLTVSDAAVARGTFSLSGQGFSPNIRPIYTGDLADFVSATFALLTENETVTPAFLTGSITLSLAFGAGSAVTASSVAYSSPNEMERLGGTSASFGGTFATDNSNIRCGSADGCAATGQLAATTVPNPVPEPVSMSLIGIGLLCLVAARRARAA